MLLIKRKIGDQVKLLANGEEINIKIVSSNLGSSTIGIEADHKNVFIMRDNCTCISCRAKTDKTGALVSINQSMALICIDCFKKLERGNCLYTPIGIVKDLPEVICKYGEDKK